MRIARPYIDRSELLQIIVANMRDGESIGAHSSNFTRAIVARTKVRLRKKIADGLVPANPASDDILVALEDVCFGIGAPGPSGYDVRPGSRYLMNSEPSCPQDEEWYSSVTTLDIFETLVPDDQWRLLFGPLADKTGNASYDPLVIDQLTPDWRASFAVEEPFSYGNPIAWFTPRYELRQAIKQSVSRADAARDKLGLVHRREPTHLVVIHFPTKVLDTKRSGRPTFADAGRHRRFMMRAAGSPPPYEKTWGQTLDLDLFALNRALSDGAKERVVASVRAADLVGFRLEVTYLGALTETRGNVLTARTSFAGSDVEFASMQVARDSVKYSNLADSL